MVEHKTGNRWVEKEKVFQNERYKLELKGRDDCMQEMDVLYTPMSTETVHRRNRGGGEAPGTLAK